MQNYSLIKEIRKRGFLAATRTYIRNSLTSIRTTYLVKFWGMNIHPKTMISLKCNLDKTNPKGIYIDQGTLITFDVVILTHDFVRGLHVDTSIGKFCAIGARTIIMPGIKIGDHCVVGAGTVVTKDVPSRSIIVGNPGKIIRQNIMTTWWGQITEQGSPV